MENDGTYNKGKLCRQICLHPSAFPYLPFLCADMYMSSNSVRFLKTDSAIILKLGLLKCETVK